MTGTANQLLPVRDDDRLTQETSWEQLRDWVRTELVWYAGSFSFHLMAAFGLAVAAQLWRRRGRG